jgi:hypothetical protein
MNPSAVLADLVIGLHVLYIAIVFFGQLAVMIGWPLGWHWIRNPWFRVIHLSMIVIVAVEAAVQFECPLTTLEYWLRVQAGQLPANFRELDDYQFQDLSFIGRHLQDLLFCRGITEILTWCYYGFAAMVVATWVLVPPRFRRRVVEAANQS